MSKLYVPPFMRRSNIKPSAKFQKETKVDIAQDRRLTKIEKKIKDVKPEIKYRDVDTGDNPFYFFNKANSNTYGLVALTTNQLFPQGDGPNNRNGDVIKPISVDIRMDITNNSSNDSNFGRIIIFQASCPLDFSTGTPQTDLGRLYSILQYANIQSLLDSPYSVRSDIKYKILYDKTIKLGNANSGNYNHFKRIKLKKKLSPIEYGVITNSSGVKTTVDVKNQLYMLMIDNINNATASNHAAYEFIARIRFTDA